MKRILLKISGEALSSEKWPIDPGRASSLAKKIHDIKNTGIEIIIVIGGGNIYRWSKLIEAWLDPADSHNMSMLSTVFNALTLKNFLDEQWEDVVIMDALWVEFLEKYSAIEARNYISDWKIIISSSWTGTPFFTTDTAGVLRALELHCDAMIKLTKVDGVYDSDPNVNPDAKKIQDISYNDFIAQDLGVLDTTAVILARDGGLPIYITSIEDTAAVYGVISGKNIASKIS